MFFQLASFLVLDTYLQHNFLQQQELDYIFKELAIEYADKFNTATRPEIKLLMTFGMAVLSVDSQNRLREHIKPEEKYADL